jgi:hypothetical protein
MTRVLVNPVQRTVPKEWQRQLSELWPRSEEISWPLLIWEAGYPWEPVNRWMIYEMLPPHAVLPDILEQLMDAAPPKGHWDAVLDEYIHEDDKTITTRAWHLWREYQCWGRPLWVIQGKNGGHKRWFNPTEKKLLQLAGLPSEPAAPGDLPYAPFDNRVIAKLVQHDLLRDMSGVVRSALGKKKILTLAGTRRAEDDAARDFRKKLLAWLYEQIEEVAGDVTTSLLALDAPRRDLDTSKLQAALERDEEAFITAGRPGLIS